MINTITNTYLLRILALVLLLLPFLAQAAILTVGDYKNRAEVESFISEMVSSSDYSEAELVQLFSQVKHQRHLFERMNKPAEKKLEWHQYRKIFITEKRINQGKAFLKEHRILLNKIEQKYKVPAEIITAIIGVETFYGIYKGKMPVFDTLVTFAFDYPKRATFFKRELKEFLLLSRSQGFDQRSLMGSYAGAMGIPQFISSSYRHYAVDFDGDNKADLFNSLPDVLASVANYFVRHGWQADAPVAYPIKAGNTQKADKLGSGFKLDYQWQDLTKAGFSVTTVIEDDTAAALIKLVQKEGPEYWVGLKNFYVITRYNHSDLYAMAVYQLSQKIK